jgi:prepilin-type N-terminal cleavage/methylation domain-containing protein
MTLLELIVVIVILGILAAIAIPTFLSIINSSRSSAMETTAHAIDSDALALAAFGNPGGNPADTSAGVASTTYYAQAVTEVTTPTGWLTPVVTSVPGSAGPPVVPDKVTVCVSDGSGHSVKLTSAGAAGSSGTVTDYATNTCS